MVHRKYSPDEIDRMRRAISLLLEEPGNYDMRYYFNLDGVFLNSAGWSLGDHDKGAPRRLEERAERELRTLMGNGTDPQEIETKAAGKRFRLALEVARRVVSARADQKLPTPQDCFYVKMIKDAEAGNN